ALLAAAPGDLVGQPVNAVLWRLIELAEVLGSSVEAVMGLAAKAPWLLSADLGPVGVTVAGLARAAEQRLHVLRPRTLISAVLQCNPHLLCKQVADMEAVMSLLAEHREGSYDARNLWSIRYHINWAPEQLASWLQADVERVLRIKYMTEEVPSLKQQSECYSAWQSLLHDPILAPDTHPAFAQPGFKAWLAGQMRDRQRSGG
ncbi:hypothetical protein Agub_g13994, partial [Astrephomene gubernaculifera]